MTRYIYVSQMSYVHPEIKYFRVLENDWNEAIEYLKPGSILKIESIDPESYAVKFVNVEQTLPTSCRVVFEPLLYFCEYTLKEIVSSIQKGGSGTGGAGGAPCSAHDVIIS